MFTVFFETNSYTIDDNQVKKLNSYLDTLPKQEIFSISIVGYTDDTGKKEANKILSSNRATSIVEILANKEFPMNKLLEFSGKGYIPLSDTNVISLEDQRKNNRRVEVVIQILEESNIERVDYESAKVNDIIRLPEVFFEPGSHILTTGSYRTLSYLLFYMRKNEKFEIAILGHICCLKINTDAFDHGTGLHNLSEARAESVYNFLVENGIDGTRLYYKGMKGDFPTGEGDKVDRRVELIVLDI